MDGLRITYVDPEEDNELYGQAYDVANAAGIRPSSAYDPTLVACTAGGQVVGAIFSGTHRGDDDAYIWSFDVAVDPGWQGVDQIGMRLIKAAEKEGLNGDYDRIELQVVNPRLAKILQHPKFGYTMTRQIKWCTTLEKDLHATAPDAPA